MMQKRSLLVAVIISLVMAAGFAGAVLLLDRGEGLSVIGMGKKVGVVEINGTITSAAPTIFDLQDFCEDSSIKAIILRVDSPGGGVAASQEIFREVGRTAQVKPVVCSMGEVAASGGYYVAEPCTKIMASPGTITGSIGVIASVPNVTDLFGKLGIQMQYVQAGKLKGAGAPGRPLSAAERQMLQQVIDQSHEQFISDVAAARDLDPEKLRAVADGRVILGEGAIELGLVDETGNFNDAVDLAAELAGIDGQPQLVWPSDEERSWLARLLEDQVTSFINQVVERIQAPRVQYIFNPAATQ